MAESAWTVCVAPPMFKLLLGETMGRDCALVYGVSDRTASCWGFSCVGLALEGWRGGRSAIRVRFCLGATGVLMIAALVCSDAGTDHDLQVPVFEGVLCGRGW